MSPLRIKVSNKLPLILFLIFFLLGLFTFKNFGISLDEEFHRSSGLYWLKYLFSFTNFDYLVDTINTKYISSKGLTVPQVEEDPYYGVIFDLPLAFIETIFGFNDFREIFYLKHLFTFIVFFIGSIFFYKILLNRYSNNLISLIGTLFFVLSPRIYGHSFYNPKDIIFLSLMTIALYFCFKTLEKINFKNIFLFSIFCALATSQRIWGLLLPLSFLAYYFLGTLSLKKDLKFFPMIVFYFFSFVFFTIIFWPYLWSDPLTNLIEAFKYFSNHPHLDNINILFNGDYIKPNSLPFYYILYWISITTPILYIFLFLIGYLKIFIRFFLKFLKIEKNNFSYDLWRGSQEKKDLFILLIFSLIIFYLILFNSSIFTGWRHLFFLNTFIIYIAVHGVYFISLQLNSLLKLKAFYSLIVFYIIFIAYQMFMFHPFQSFYFNILSNKKNFPIHKRFEIDYWGISGTNFLKYVLDAEKNSEKILVASASYGDLERSKKLLDKKSRSKILLVGQEFTKADYIYTNFTSEVDKKFDNKYEIPSNFKKIYSLKVANIIVYDVYIRKNLK